jgi:hypothetical protein
MTSLNTPRFSALLTVAALAWGTTACQDFLDVNTNPNAPDQTSANNYLAPMLHYFATSEQFDGRFVGRMAQEWVAPPATIGSTPGNWERMGYDPTSDNAAQLYRDVYWSMGLNLGNMITQAEAEERWDLAGIGYALRAWGWLKLTDLHGEIIVSEAFTPDQFRFAFNTQEEVFTEIFRLVDRSIELLSRTDGRLEPAYIAVGDKIYNGDRTKWLRLAWGLKAMALNQLSNKSSYNPQAVMDAVDQSFLSNADDALFPYPKLSATFADDRNFWDPARANLGAFRQTNFIVGLMNGTQYPGAPDPRMTRMLVPDSTGVYRGIDPLGQFPALTRERPWNLFGTGSTTANPPVGTQGRYLFDERVRFPIMTYAQQQFIKAEAAVRAGNQGAAQAAYTNGISAHIDFVNARIAEIGNVAVPQITASEKAAFLANPSIVPAVITLSHVMGQKFIAQWAWSHVEAWTDERRYHYTDMDPISGTQVFRGFVLPSANYYPDNNGRPAYRIRPRFNSDYVWNREELYKIGGLALDYHTKIMWLFQP